MESHDIDLEARQAQGPFVEERETENLSDGVPGVEQRERHAQQSTGTNACATERQPWLQRSKCNLRVPR